MPHTSHPSYLHLLPGALFLLLLCVGVPSICAQTSEPHRGFSPAGSYALSDLEIIDVANGNLMLNFPLGKLPAGRGGTGGQIGLHYNSKLFDGRAANFADHRPTGIVSVPGRALSQSDEGGWRYGIYYWWELIDRNDEDAVTYEYPDNQAKYRYKVKVHFPDGSAHEFTPQADASHQLLNDGYWNLRPDGYYTDWSGGGCYPANCVYPHDYLYYTGTMVYYSTDGTYLRLEFQHDADDYNPYNNPWTLYMPDGTRVTNGIVRQNGDCAAQCFYDRNGNYVEVREITYNGHFTYQLMDQLGRDVKLECGSATDEDTLHVTGFGGVTLDYRVKWKTIWVGRQYQPTQECVSCPQTIGPLRVVSELDLPAQADGLKYTFGYNAPDYTGAPPPAGWSVGWGELSSVTLPSGGQVKYRYQQDNSTELIMTEDALNNSAAQKDLIYRPEYDLTVPVSNTPCAPQTETCVTETWTYSFGYGAGGSMQGPDGGVSAEALDEYKHSYRSTHPDGTVVERRWLQNMPWSYPPPLNPQFEGVNGYVKTEFTTIRDAGGNLAKTAIKDYKYDKNGNVTEVREYDWVAYEDVPRDNTIYHKPTGVIPGSAVLKRVTKTGYYNQTVDAADSTTAEGNAYHVCPAGQLNRLASWSEVSPDGAQVKARAEFTYDAGGNLTGRKNWDSTKGGYSNPLGAGNSVSTAQEYDGYGNPTLATDAKGNQTLLVYGSVGGFTGLYPTATHSAYQTALELTTTQAYDFSTGLATQTTDPNGVVTTMSYDAFGRSTLVRAAAGLAEETRVQTEYSDANRRVIVRRDLTTIGDGKLVAVQHYDQLGRVRLTRQLENAAAQSATDETTGIKVQTRYAFSGQNSYQLVSNPYRAAYSYQATGEPAMGWTRAKADNAGRTVEVRSCAGAALPAPWGANTNDGGAVVTAYDANSTTVMDQAGKKRKSVTDALGRLSAIYEDPLGLNYQTSYGYDALDNLTTVTQGTQTRTFVYDSLKRLSSATNPESGTVSYQYDANGNLAQKIDARGITTTYGYDGLNRNTTVNYSNTTANPDINRYYDNPNGYGKGRYYYDNYYKDDGTIEQQATDFYDAVGRTYVRRQNFYANGQWYGYQISRSFDKAGHVTSETYPSGHTVNYNYDAAGRLNDNGTNLAFTGNLGDGMTRTYAQGLSYDAASRMQAERYGTTVPLYHKLHYNVRGQLYDVRLSTQSWQAAEWDWNRGGLINYYSQHDIDAVGNAARGLSGPDNNGNLLRSEMWIPTDPNGSYDGVTGAGSYAMSQARYEYDALNRLLSVSEYQNGQTAAYTQAYTYDCFGNRTIDQTHTWGAEIPAPLFELEMPASTTNRLHAPGDMSLPENQRALRYDAAGNLIYDYYSPQTRWGWRKYDAENRMVEQDTTVEGQWVSKYAYDADGHRVRRNVGGQETWQVYGLDGELVAEYRASAPAAQPQKEYGYRNGELLVTAAAGADSVGRWPFDEGTGMSAADASGNGQTGTLQEGATWGTGRFGSAATFNGTDAYVQMGTSSQLVMTNALTMSAWIYPTGAGSDATMGGTILSKEGEYLLVRFADGTIRCALANTTPGWAWVNTGYVAPLNQWTQIAVTYDGTAIKTYANGTLVHSVAGAGAIGDYWSTQNEFRVGGRQNVSQYFAGRIDEVRVYNRALTAAEVANLAGEAGGAADIEWLISDHLGTPRMIADLSGGLSGIKRHDYLPFGEEIGAGVGGRMTGQGYSQVDNVRQHFTRKERDKETGLDYFGARYYSKEQGRFTSIDPLRLSAKPTNPQTWNRYSYALNRATIAIDPDGLATIVVTVNPKGHVTGTGQNQTQTPDATVWVHKRDGTYQREEIHGLATGTGGRTRTVPTSDTPYGVYRIKYDDNRTDQVDPKDKSKGYTGTQGGVLGSMPRGPAYGTGIVYMAPVAGEAMTKAPDGTHVGDGIYMHGGGSILGVHAGDENQTLVATHGCIRLHNGDVNSLIGTINDLRTAGDPVDNVFVGDAPTLNAMAEDKDKDGKYLYPDLRLALGVDQPPANNNQPQH